MIKEHHAVYTIFFVLFALALLPIIVWLITPDGLISKPPIFNDNVIILLLIVIILIMVYLWGHIKEEVFNFATKRGSKRFKQAYHGTNIDLVSSYIIEAQKSRATSAKITHELEKVGWPSHLIAMAFDEAKEKAKTDKKFGKKFFKRFRRKSKK